MLAEKWASEKRVGNFYASSECPLDPRLTPLGEEQALANRSITQLYPEGYPELIFVSPMRRAVKTALLSFGGGGGNDGGDIRQTQQTRRLSLLVWSRAASKRVSISATRRNRFGRRALSFQMLISLGCATTQTGPTLTFCGSA